MKGDHMWSWYASGKHPIFRDFFKMGVEDSMLKAFADWAAGGFQQLVSVHGSNRTVSMAGLNSRELPNCRGCPAVRWYQGRGGCSGRTVEPFG